MADRVVGAAHPLPVAVVCDDTDVAEWARARGALVVWEPGRGLNGAVEAGVDHLLASGVTQVTVAHADLPRASDLALVGEAPGITLVPDRYGNGTNVIALPGRRRLPVLLRSGLVRPPPGRGRTARAARPGPRPARPGLGHRRARRRRPGGRLRARRRGDRHRRRSATGPPGPSGLPVGDLLADRSRSRSTFRCRPSRWPSAPTPTTSSSAVVPPWPNGRRPGAGSTTWSSPTARRAAGTPTPTSPSWWPSAQDECRAAAAVIDGDPDGSSDRRRPGAVPRSGGRRAGERRRRASGGGPDHPHGASGRRAGPRPLAPLPAPSRPPGRRLPHPRRAGGGTGPAFLPRARAARHTDPRRCCCSRPTCPTTSRTPAGSRTPRSRPCSATAASASRPWASTGRTDGTAAAAEADDRASPPRCGGSWPSTDRWPASPSAEAFHLITDL